MLVLVEGGQLLLYDLTATTRQPPAPPTPLPARLSEKRSGSPSKQRVPVKQPPQQQQQQDKVPPPPPPVQQLFKGQLQGKSLVTAARLRMIPIQPVPLRGLQVGRLSCWLGSGLALFVQVY